MKIKKNLEVSTGDFWYDISTGGYLDPHDICENEKDVKKVETAIAVLKDFEESCEEQIEGFVQ